MDDLKSPSIDFPAFCLASPDQLISVSGTGGMPDLVSYWLNKPLRYDPLGNNITDFDTISYTISSNVLTVTFPSTTACLKIIDAFGEDYQVQGSFTNWMTGTILQTIGGIPANSTLAITAFSSASRTISFSCTATNSSGSLSGVKIRFYKHRLPDITPGTTITNQVRHFTVQGRGFVSVMDSDSDWIGGLRRRDRLHDHAHDLPQTVPNNTTTSSTPGGGPYWIGTTRIYTTGGAVANNNGSPRTGKTTDARGISGFPYIFVRRVL